MNPLLATHYGADAMVLFIGLPVAALMCGILAAIFALRKRRNVALCVLGAIFSTATGAMFVNSTGGHAAGLIDFGIIWLPLLVGGLALGLLAFTSLSRHRRAKGGEVAAESTPGRKPV